MYRVIKSEELKNQSQYRWFKTFANPCYGFNVKMDVTEVVKYCKETKTSFFINVLYLITTSLNSIEEFRIREVKDEIRIYDTINPTYTVMTDVGVYENAGFKMVASSKPAEEYPTTTCAEGFNGDCIKLTTRDTGLLGKASKMPIAAGSIFIGEFDSSNAMKAPLEATRMGMQILPQGVKPLSLTGYYKYTPGEKFTDKNKKEVEGRRDACSVYAVVFEVDPNNFEPLNGANVTSSERIVLIAEMQNPGEPTEWERFDIPFEPMNGKEFDYEKLANNEYAITIVASSSKDGAFFEGAVGSTLLIDEIKIEWENK